jgi:hypothetical protein
MPAKKANEYAAGNDGGRPADFNDEFIEQAYKLCLLGATDAHLADFFHVDVDTINEWKAAHEAFALAIKKGKYFADATIAQSMYNRAKGMSITKEAAIKLTEKSPVLDADGKPTRGMKQTERIEIVSLVEELPPDTTAGTFWLKNRQPKEWRDKQEIAHTGNEGGPLILKIGYGSKDDRG